MSRRMGRILAFQGLYSWEAGGMSKEDILELSWADSETGKDVVDLETATFARVLIAGAIENQAVIDGYIKKNLKGWEFDRVNKVSLSILRMSVYSLLFQKDIPPSIVIDEAVDISREYGQDDSYKFVNAVLDNIGKACAKENSVK
ncbi:MAG: transcription antitermination factor NusB [Spirochaetia bacterium]|uniref:transcription antitermination factor NusB n=1 Tax=uncultured Treponema sp. TaxID=162155 RepID=UPI0015B99113|nr:transcription antitermination factor NusB [uncultured Treponema sp.]MDD5789004.1 transcription antitermination factor NusB [Spirochaetia bacterium]